MTVIQNKDANPIAHLSKADIAEIGRKLDAIRQEFLEARGASDAAYIRKVIKTQRYLEMGSRGVLLFSIFPPAFILGTLGLSVSKILENMEIGHNVLHGQWDWMRDEKIHSSTWEWDNVTPSEAWKHSHNEVHHTYTNIVGKDNDLGYGIMRVDEDQKWYPMYIVQPAWNFLNACFFQYGIAAYDLELGKNLKKPKDKRPEGFDAEVKKVLVKIRKHMVRDYGIHPLLSIPTGSFFSTIAANLVANWVRNVWTHSVIMCGHFPEGVETFEKDMLDEDETRGDWYIRQMLGSANITGSKLTHIMTGNLSHQIEHHLFPDLPSNRYAEIRPQVKAIFEEYDLNYHEASLPAQVYSAWHKVFRLSLPNGFTETTTIKNLPKQIGLLSKMVTGDKRTRRLLQRHLDNQLRAKRAKGAKVEADEVTTAA